MTETCRLSDLRRGTPARVVEVEPAHAPRLAALGLHHGTLLTVEQDGPLGGARIVRLGTARLALARALTRGVEVRIEGLQEDPEQ